MAARSVPLFEPGQDGTVERISLGQRRTPFLRRSTAMEAMVGHAAAELLTAPPQEAVADALQGPGAERLYRSSFHISSSSACSPTMNR